MSILNTREGKDPFLWGGGVSPRWKSNCNLTGSMLVSKGEFTGGTTPQSAKRGGGGGNPGRPCSKRERSLEEERGGVLPHSRKKKELDPDAKIKGSNDMKRGNFVN